MKVRFIPPPESDATVELQENGELPHLPTISYSSFFGIDRQCRCQGIRRQGATLLAVCTRRARSRCRLRGQERRGRVRQDMKSMRHGSHAKS